MRKAIIFLLAVYLLFPACSNESKRRNTNIPTDSTYVTLPLNNPTVNVYIENSGSMDGYVKGVTEFEQLVYNYLTEIEILDLTDSLNLFYINSEIIPQGSDISNFIEKLDPDNFKAKGGKRGISDISQVLKLVLSETNEDEIAILITDGIFSPGKGKNAAEYLLNQQIGIKSTMAQYLKTYPNTAVAVYQLSSQFDGYYYNREDSQIKINDKRPFYIWLFGDFRNIAILKEKIREDQFKGGVVEHAYTILPALQTEIQYAILNSPKNGSFERDKKASKTSIYNIKKETKGKNEGKFMFTIGVDLSLFNVLLGDEYLMDTDSYARLVNKKASSDLFVEINHNENTSQKYTHNMQLSCEKIPVGDLEIVLMNRMPQWVYDLNDEEGFDIKANNAISKTFGIKYLVEGIFEAYDMLGNNIYAKMNLKLNK